MQCLCYSYELLALQLLTHCDYYASPINGVFFLGNLDYEFLFILNVANKLKM